MQVTVNKRGASHAATPGLQRLQINDPDVEGPVLIDYETVNKTNVTIDTGNEDKMTQWASSDTGAVHITVFHNKHAANFDLSRFTDSRQEQVTHIVAFLFVKTRPHLIELWKRYKRELPPTARVPKKVIIDGLLERISGDTPTEK